MSCHTSLTSLNDNDLLAHLAELRCRERETTLEILRHLNEIERRKLHLKLGYATMFDYCTHHLKYSESAAGRRIQTARCMRRFRPVERLLERDELTLSSVSMIASILDEKNADDILARVRGKPRRDVEAVVANYKPPVRLRDRVQPVRVNVPVSNAEPASHSRRGSEQLLDRTTDGLKKCASHCEPESSEKPMPDIRTESRLWIQFLADPAFMDKYNEACALLSNKLPKPSFAAVFGAVLDEFITRHSPREKQARREQRNAATPVARSSVWGVRPAGDSRENARRRIQSRPGAVYVRGSERQTMRIDPGPTRRSHHAGGSEWNERCQESKTSVRPTQSTRRRQGPWRGSDESVSRSRALP